MELLTSTGADLSFVHLGITIEHLRNSISIFGFRIAFYGIIIGCGMLAGMAVAFSDAKRRGQDPVCKNGYVRGSDTYEFVHEILARAELYRKKIKK